MRLFNIVEVFDAFLMAYLAAINAHTICFQYTSKKKIKNLISLTITNKIKIHLTKNSEITLLPNKGLIFTSHVRKLHPILSANNYK